MALVFTAAQMRISDRWAIETLGIPGLVLMENAGRGVARLVENRIARLARRASSPGPGGPIRGLKEPCGGDPKPLVVVVCGSGQNGGDGFVVARHLHLAGCRVRVLLCLPAGKISGDAATNLAALECLEEIELLDLSDRAQSTDALAWDEALASADVVVDAIFGIGLRGPVRGAPARAINAMNRASRSGADVVAVDVPSGLDADTGEVCGVAVHADLTAAAGALKPGLVLTAGGPSGTCAVVDLGVPLFEAPAKGHGAPRLAYSDRRCVGALLPASNPAAHKGSRGHVLMIAGSEGKTGAACLAAAASLRAGAGLVTIGAGQRAQAALDQKVVEAMTACLEDTTGALSLAPVMAQFASKTRAAAIGPGIAEGPKMASFVRDFVTQWPTPAVVDADALNHLGVDYAKVLSRACAPRILTPHPGEAARLLGRAVEPTGAGRLATVQELARQSRCVVVLKGARTLIADPVGRVQINPAATSSLATAGSGDVLTGTLAALLAQGLGPFEAAIAGTFVHGEAAEVALTQLGTDRLTAGDLPLAIARVLSQLAPSGAQ